VTFSPGTRSTMTQPDGGKGTLVQPIVETLEVAV
jgi:hypothetical protein